MDTATVWPAFAWPGESDKVLTALQEGRGVVFYLALPQATPRSVARTAIRAALCQALASWVGCPANSVTLSDDVGVALRIAHPSTTARVSISHEDGLSVAAIHPHRAIGVDVLGTSNPPWADECLTLARDYLGPHRARQLAELPVAQRSTAFAAAWTRWEAGLKSGGLGISEWTAALQESVDRCHTTWLELPQGYCGAVALQHSGAP